MLDPKDIKAWRDLGRCEMTVKLLLSNLEFTLKRLEQSEEHIGMAADAYVVMQVKDGIRMCQTCLADCGEAAL